MRTRPSGSLARCALALALGAGLAALGCGDGKVRLPSGPGQPGTAVVILIDTSGSMAQDVSDRGAFRPKHQIAREALERIIQNTGRWRKDNPNKPLQLAIYNFSSSVSELLPMGDFDEAKARAALARLPSPNSGTAIGTAIEHGYQALYQSGYHRKFLLCITDGENTAGTPPERVARQLHLQTKGEVKMYFIAFDIAANKFRFVKEVGGEVVEASNGDQLQAHLANIYEKKILAEAEEPQ
jgi:Mg-chelatase subunit ChlD